MGHPRTLERQRMRHPNATSGPSLFDVLPQWYHPFDANMLNKNALKGWATRPKSVLGGPSTTIGLSAGGVGIQTTISGTQFLMGPTIGPDGSSITYTNSVCSGGAQN